MSTIFSQERLRELFFNSVTFKRDRLQLLKQLFHFKCYIMLPVAGEEGKKLFLSQCDFPKEGFFLGLHT